jgi:aminoglycoside 3-N-acetyltransferase I
MEVARLLQGDVEAARALNALFAQAFEDDGHYLSDPPPADYLAQLLAKPEVIALVALEGAEMVGGLVAYELPKFEKAHSEIYIYDLAVAETNRRNGVATALIEELRAIARECGAWVVYVQADYGDEPAIALYTKLGSREDVMHFDIDVAEGEKA